MNRIFIWNLSVGRVNAVSELSNVQQALLDGFCVAVFGALVVR
ncbi:MAG: hypothetical protein ACJAUP_003380, partial [Cellvibrionaceae bacterium]